MSALTEADTGAPLCAEVSRAVGETLIGTASKDGLRFILVETDDPWGPDAFESSTLSPAAKDHLSDALDAVPRTRLVFVRPAGRQAAVPRVYVTGGASRGERTVVLDLASFEAIAHAPLAAMLLGTLPEGARIVDEPIALVCTHGKRDRCCAKFGVALVNGLASEAGILVLQASIASQRWSRRSQTASRTDTSSRPTPQGSPQRCAKTGSSTPHATVVARASRSRSKSPRRC